MKGCQGNTGATAVTSKWEFPRVAGKEAAFGISRLSGTKSSTFYHSDGTVLEDFVVFGKFQAVHSERGLALTQNLSVIPPYSCKGMTQHNLNKA